MSLPEYFRHINIHTHNRAEGDGGRAIISLMPGDDPTGLQRFSAGIHPWYADRCDEKTWQTLENMVADPGCVAIGECGLDRRHTPAVDYSTQLTVFERQIRLSEQLKKPLIIHNVAADADILRLKKKYSPQQPWIIHGYRGNSARAAHLQAAGLLLSTPDSTSSPDFLHETDSPA